MIKRKTILSFRYMFSFFLATRNYSIQPICTQNVVRTRSFRNIYHGSRIYYIFYPIIDPLDCVIVVSNQFFIFLLQKKIFLMWHLQLESLLTIELCMVMTFGNNNRVSRVSGGVSLKTFKISSK